MPRYDYRCTRCGRVREVVHAMTGERPLVYCACGERCARVFGGFYFQEDRVRFWRAADGSRRHIQLGQDMPDTRQEYNRLLKERDQEAVPWSEVPPHFKRAQEVAKFNIDETAHGGEALPAEKVAEYVNEPQEPLPSVQEQLDAIGYRRGAGSSTDGLSKMIDV